jgi:hypothetical protein
MRTKISGIDRELLHTVVGGGWVRNAVDVAGPGIGWFYAQGSDWNNIPCITRASISGDAVGLGTKYVASGLGLLAGRFGKRGVDRLAKAGLGFTAGSLLGDGAKSWVKQYVQAEYMKTCNFAS